jgi:hypothetical protein
MEGATPGLSPGVCTRSLPPAVESPAARRSSSCGSLYGRRGVTTPLAEPPAYQQPSVPEDCCCVWVPYKHYGERSCPRHPWLPKATERVMPWDAEDTEW